MHLETDDDLVSIQGVLSHRLVSASAPSCRHWPLLVVIGPALEGIGHTQQSGLIQRTPQELHAYRKTILFTAGERNPGNPARLAETV